MADGTGISWTDATWNPVRGCSKVSPGCTHCYAERVAIRFSGPGQPYHGLADVTRGRWTGDVRMVPEHLADPLRWRKPRRIFVNSMSDLFHEALTNDQIAAVFGVMAAAPQHTFQVLTKRAERMRDWFGWVSDERTPLMRFDRSPLLTCTVQAHEATGMRWTVADPARWPLPNVWLGVSVEDQAAADERIPHLLATPAAVRFLSCEPLLGEVQIEEIPSLAGYAEKALAPECWGDCNCDAVWGEDPGCRRNGGDGRLTRRIDWVIAGCESGPGARPCDVAWLRSLRDQCADARVPFFLKQAASRKATPDRGTDWMPRDEHGTSRLVIEHGPGSKKKAGGVIELPYLDGVQHAAFPEVRP